MRIRTLALTTSTVAIAAAAAVAAPHAQAGVTKLPFQPQAFNDSGVVVGAELESRGAVRRLVRWSAANGVTEVPRPSDGVGALNVIDDAGLIWGTGTRDPGSINMSYVWKGALTTAVTLVSSDVNDTQNVSITGNVVGYYDKLGRQYRHEYKDGDIVRVDRNSVAVVGGRFRDVYHAPDGSFAVAAIKQAPEGGRTYVDDPANHRYVPSNGAPVPLPANRTPFRTGSNGYVLAYDGAQFHESGVWHLLKYANGAWSDTALPPLLERSDVGNQPIFVSGGGKIVAQLSMPGPLGFGVFQLKPGQVVWEDITTALSTQSGDPAKDRPGPVAVNAWGDVLAEVRVSSDDANRNGGALMASRTALTGQVQPTGPASGGGRAASLKGKLVTLGDGSVTFTAALDAKGKFTIDVPASDAWTLSAPAGTCLVTGNGCHASAKLAPVVEGAKPIALAKTPVPNLATFVAKAKSSLKVANGKVSTMVTCNATASPCAVTVTLRSGTKVYGTGKATVPTSKSKAVVITLSAAAKAYLAGKPTAAVGATLVATSKGAPKLTTIQAFTLKR